MRKLIILSILFCATFAQERLAIREPQCPTNEDPFNPTHLAHPSDCTKFYKCELGRAYEFTCPRGHHWNSRMGYCDFPDLANCQSNIQPPTRPAGPTRPAPTRPIARPTQNTWPTWATQPTARPTGWPTQNTWPTWGTQPTARPTGWPTQNTRPAWPTASTPSWPWVTSARPTNSWTTNTQPSWNWWTTPNPNTVVQMICPNTDTPGVNIFFSNPFDCGSFYQCNSGRAVLYRCPAGQHWSEPRQCCDFIQNATCVQAVPYNDVKNEAEKLEEIKAEDN